MQFEKWTDLDISKGRAAIMDLGPILFSGDNHALKLGVHVYNGTEPVTVTGSVAGSAIIANGQTITPFVTGKDGNAAWVEVPQAALVCQGRIEIFLRVSDDDEIAVSLYATGTVKRTTTDEAVNPGTVIPDIGTAVQECVDATAAANDAAGRAETAALTAVTYAAQSEKTEAEKAQARTNIGAADAEDCERADTVLRGVLGLMDYRGEDADYAEVPGATNASCIGAVVRGETVTLNGTNNATGYVYLRLSGNCAKNASSNTVRGWEGNFASPAGHLIRCTLALISGTVEGSASVSFYKSGTSSTIGTTVRHDGTIFQREWTSDGDPISVTLLVAKDTVLTNAKFLLVMQDITNAFGVLPTPPETNGTYTLKVTVTDGVPAYAWVSESAGLMSVSLMSAAPEAADPTGEEG